MSDEADADLIVEMLDATDRVRTYVALDGRNGFLRQGLVYDAVCMNLLRIGECARFLSDDLKNRLPTIPWPDIISLRNRVAHGYETLKPDVLWLIASESLPELDASLRSLDER
ncbi:HepT-like ribonuclease domain-containing protein [uncultured Brevundimonas sp.]|uniref:HepT-like ribonuclease domain-containing protein n=1 Tax=uncultured Brevundimonas sp. TaxID=213418 RepID=UPI0025919256|nr:HepT-like ribonuclease domain-containing protein [uncultured Brevundimonas sp.]